MATDTAHVAATRSKSSEITAFWPRRTTLKGAILLLYKRLAIRKKQNILKVIRASGYLAPKQTAQELNVFECFPHLSVPLVSEHHSTFAHVPFHQLLFTYTLILSKHLGDGDFVAGAENCVPAVSTTSTPGHQTSSPRGHVKISDGIARSVLCSSNDSAPRPCTSKHPTPEEGSPLSTYRVGVTYPVRHPVPKYAVVQRTPPPTHTQPATGCSVSCISQL